MKILHINSNYMGTRLHQTMIDHLDDREVQSVVFAPINYAKSSLVTKPTANVVVSDCFKSIDRYFFYIKQHKIRKSLLNKIKVAEFDCIHAYTLFTDGNCAYTLSKQYGIPYVVAIRATDIEFFKYRINLRNRGIEILKNASRVFFLSETTKKFVFEHYIPKKYKEDINRKVEIIPNGIDDYWLDHKSDSVFPNEKTERISRKCINVCCVCEIIKRKNVPFLEEAIQELINRGWNIHLDVVGKKTDLSELKKIQQYKFANYHEPVNKDVLIDLYKKSDLFALVSVGETFGLVYPEAMSQGLPVIYTKGEGFDGQFHNGTVGYAVNPNNRYNIADSIERIFENYETIVKNCEGQVDRYRWNDICTQYQGIYREIISNGGKSV